MPTYLEFFAGGGMARAGLGKGWNCVLANDFDAKKGQTYAQNWGHSHLIIDDIGNISTDDIPQKADLAWASFPCQDLSLAGVGAGLKGARSGTFWPFIALMQDLKRVGRDPDVIVLENVLGTLTSHGGADFTAIIAALSKLGYHSGAMVIDAALFVPHSRPRLFIIAAKPGADAPGRKGQPHPLWHTRAVQKAYDGLPRRDRRNWVWWDLKTPAKRTLDLADIIEETPDSVRWHTQKETTALLSMMSEVNLAKVETAQMARLPMVGTIYKRTRKEHGIKVQRAEIRFDNVAGCLRTPGGGSSRQVIMTVDGPHIRSRLMSSRETARLMGLPDSYKLPQRYNEAYHLTGDGVVVPVVRHLAHNLIEPLLKELTPATRTARAK
jgi:DNA (cytosine-5)-methyltransferase 1